MFQACLVACKTTKAVVGGENPQRRSAGEGKLYSFLSVVSYFSPSTQQSPFISAAFPSHLSLLLAVLIPLPSLGTNSLSKPPYREFLFPASSLATVIVCLSCLLFPLFNLVDAIVCAPTPNSACFCSFMMSTDVLMLLSSLEVVLFPKNF